MKYGKNLTNIAVTILTCPPTPFHFQENVSKYVGFSGGDDAHILYDDHDDCNNNDHGHQKVEQTLSNKLPVLSILSPGAASFGEDRQGNLMSDNTIDDVDQYESRFDPIQLDYID